MPRFDEMLTIAEQLALAVRAHAPAHVARHFAALARRFRTRLDQRLSDRHHSPVRWDTLLRGDADDRAA